MNEFVQSGVSRETIARLRAFEQTFHKWADRINLIAPSTRADFWTRHVLDSLQLLSLSQATRWLDVGSGGGFPGLVVAIALAERPGSFVRLIESNQKKAAFLRSIIAQFQLSAEVSAIRIEDANLVPGSVDVVTARALAPLERLLPLVSPWLTTGAIGLFHKGRDYRAELEQAADSWTFDLVEHPSATDSQGVILQISNLVQV